MKTTNTIKPAVLKTCTAAANAAEAHAHDSAAWAHKAEDFAAEAAVSAVRASRWTEQNDHRLSHLALQNMLLLVLSSILTGFLFYLVIFE